MLVYRIEHADTAQGPLRKGHNYGLYKNDDWRWHFNRLPTPGVDCFYTIKPGEVCGCATLKTLLKWFPRAIRKFLAHHGYELVVYECEPVAHGKYQVIFEHLSAKPVKVISL